MKCGQMCIRSCETCKSSLVRDDDKIMECRFNPPMIAYSPKHDDIVSGFPAVEPDYFCMKWESVD